MSFFERFRKKSAGETVVIPQTQNVQPSNPIQDGMYIDDFLPVDAEERELVTVIAGSVLAGDQKDSEYQVKTILRRNDEKAVVAAIASAVLAGDHPESSFQVRTIKQVK